MAEKEKSKKILLLESIKLFLIGISMISFSIFILISLIS